MRRPAGALAPLRAMVCLVLTLLLFAQPAKAELAVTASDLGFVTRCAEMDNVLVAMTDPTVTTFPIRVRHPAFAAGASEISQAADFTDCDFPKDQPVWHFQPASFVLYEDADFRLQGHRLQNSWRPELVPVSVGGETWPDLHLLQLLVKIPGQMVEVLVLYPADGYWRAKPLPPTDVVDTPYGASFMVGPMENDRRPLVKFKSIRFEPQNHRFTFDFTRGGSGSLTLQSASRDEVRLWVELSAPVSGAPFAVISSMYVDDSKADIGWIRSRAAGQPLWLQKRPVSFQPYQAAEFNFGRVVASRHNTLAPDFLFGPFHNR